MIELADVVRDLRAELDRARAAAEDEELRFDLGPIELEVTVGLEREGGAGAKVRFYVVELGGDAHVTASSMQRVKLTLRPTIAGRSGEGVSIAGGEAPGER